MRSCPECGTIPGEIKGEINKELKILCACGWAGKLKDLLDIPVYVAIHKKGVQISPDDFKIMNRVKILGSETTIQEIMDWSDGDNVEIAKESY